MTNNDIASPYKAMAIRPSAKPSVDGVSDAENEHARGRAVPLSDVEFGCGVRKSPAGEHGGAHDEERDSDEQGHVLGVLIDVVGEETRDRTDDEKHAHETGRERGAHGQRATNTGPLRARSTGDSEEVHEIRREQHEAARVHGGQQSTAEAEPEAIVHAVTNPPARSACA
jgi:hypothetical protein